MSIQRSLITRRVIERRDESRMLFALAGTRVKMAHRPFVIFCFWPIYRTFPLLPLSAIRQIFG